MFRGVVDEIRVGSADVILELVMPIGWSNPG